MATTQELTDQRVKLVAEARAINAKAEVENRDMSGEESKKFDTIIAEAEKLGKQIEQRGKLDKQEAALNATDDPIVGAAGTREEKRGNNDPSVEFRNKAWNHYVVSGLQTLSNEEQRALAAGTDSAGGFLFAPEQFVSRLLKRIDEQTFIRQLATIYQVTQSDSLGIPELNADPADADWTTEILTGSEDSTMDFGKRVLKPQPLAKLIKVSNKLLQIVPQADSLVVDRLAFKHAVAQEKAFLTGDGSGKPLGIFTADSAGIPTGRDVTMSGPVSAFSQVSTDNIIDVKYKVRSGYWGKAVWVMHQDALKELVSLKDSNGQFIFRVSLRVGEPDSLLGRPIHVSEFAPQSGAAAYMLAFGDFSFYHIADSLQIGVQRLNELYAATNQTGFIGRAEVDGAPVLAEAFSRLITAA